MFDAGNYWSNPVTEVTTALLPVKRGDPGRPVIPISIGMVDFPEALYAWWTSQKHFATLALVSTLCPGYSMKNSLHILY